MELKRVAELATHFQMPMAVAINKCDINPDMSGRIQSVCDGLHVPVVGRVPYDEDVTAAQIQGACVVETSDGPAATAVRSIWLSLRKTLMETE